eukprot:5486324-Pyramimonas_sp.AAC.1
MLLALRRFRPPYSTVAQYSRGRNPHCLSHSSAAAALLKGCGRSAQHTKLLLVQATVAGPYWQPPVLSPALKSPPGLATNVPLTVSTYAYSSALLLAEAVARGRSFFSLEVSPVSPVS